MWWSWWLGAAPERDVRPVVAPLDVDRRWQTHLELQGLPPDRLACAPLWPTAATLCFRVWEGGMRRWVTLSDTGRWGTSTAALTDAVSGLAAPHLAQAELLDVGGTSARYLRLVDGDGWAAAGALLPEQVAQRLGGSPIHVALPAESVLVAWHAGDGELDRIMAIGVRELYEQTPNPVSAQIQRWDGVRWTPYGEATPTAR